MVLFDTISVNDPKMIEGFGFWSYVVWHCARARALYGDKIQLIVVEIYYNGSS